MRMFAVSIGLLLFAAPRLAQTSPWAAQADAAARDRGKSRSRSKVHPGTTRSSSSTFEAAPSYPRDAADASRR